MGGEVTAIRYDAFHPLTRQRIGSVKFASHSWTEVVNGTGVLEGNIVLPHDSVQRSVILLATTPDSSVIYRRSAATNGYSEGYIVVSRQWKPQTRELSVKALEFRSWMYSVFVGPDIPTGDDVNFWYDQVDQLSIAQSLADWVTYQGTADGRPNILVESSASGKLRDLTVTGSAFKTAGELIDSMARRAGGFEWSMVPTVHSDGFPIMVFRCWYPERGTFQPWLRLRRNKLGGNFILTSDPTHSSTDVRTRVYTTGSTESFQFAVDTSPGIGSGTLLRESVTNYSSVIERTTLAAHARAERLYYEPTILELEGTVDPDKVNIDDFRAGDRCPLLYEDDVLAMDLNAVRISERKVTEQDGAVQSIQLKLDLNDYELPETDPGGAV